KNNRGTYFTLLRCDIALFLNNFELAKSIFNNEASLRVMEQISPNGELTQELKRGTPLGYVKYNLKAFKQLNLIGRKLGYDLLNFRGPKGESLNKAYEWLDKYKKGVSKWTYSSEIGISTPRRTRM